MEKYSLGGNFVGKRTEINVNVAGFAAILMLYDYTGDFDFSIRNCLFFVDEFMPFFEKPCFLSTHEIKLFLNYKGYDKAIQGEKNFVDLHHSRILVHKEKLAAVLLLWDHTGDLEYALDKQITFRQRFSCIFKGKRKLIPRKDFDKFLKDNPMQKESRVGNPVGQS